MAEGGGGVVRMRGWTGVWSFLARGECLVVLWLTLAWTVFLRRVWGEVGGAGIRAGPRGHVDGGTERTVLNREGVERVGGVSPRYWVPKERIRTQPVMCLVDSLVQVLYAFLEG